MYFSIRRSACVYFYVAKPSHFLPINKNWTFIIEWFYCLQITFLPAGLSCSLLDIVIVAVICNGWLVYVLFLNMVILIYHYLFIIIKAWMADLTINWLISRTNGWLSPVRVVACVCLLCAVCFETRASFSRGLFFISATVQECLDSHRWITGKTS